VLVATSVVFSFVGISIGVEADGAFQDAVLMRLPSNE